MDKRIASPKIRENHFARTLIGLLESWEEELAIVNGVLYVDFPLFRDESSTDSFFRPTLIFSSKSHGIVVIEPLTHVGKDASEQLLIRDEKLSQIDSILFGKFLKSPSLRSGKRDLAFPLTTIIFTDARVNTSLPDTSQNLVADSREKLKQVLFELRSPELSDLQWNELTSILEGSKGIIRPVERRTGNLKEGSRGAILTQLEHKIANFDKDQRLAAITLVDGPQRIRGLAGSGKTIVLAMKAAHIHLHNPKAKILFTFWTKSLYDLAKTLITRFYRQFAEQDPNWENIHILHAWGGRTIEGVYYNACIENERMPIALREVPSSTKDAFGYVCDRLCSEKELEQKYDYILIDEGQDFPAAFYKLCFALAKGGPTDRNIIWAYDELQTIMNTQVQNVEETFGYLADSTPKMDLARAQEQLSQDLLPHDIVLHKCYRNPPEILLTAHSIGFGIYSKQPVQMLENADHWKDLGYEIEKGQCIPGEETVIVRPESNSPLNLSEYAPRDEIIKYHSATSFADELGWITAEIFAFLDDGLLPEDILVVCLDDRNARNYFSSLSERLAEKGVAVNNVLSTPYVEPHFVLDNHVTLSTVYRAKGNEAALVLAVGIDALAFESHQRRIRNRLFTTFTRSKAWLRVSGLAPSANVFFREIEKTLQHFPRMQFLYPNLSDIELIQRDLSEKSQKLDKLRQLVFDLGLSDLSEAEVIRALKGTRKKEP